MNKNLSFIISIILILAFLSCKKSKEKTIDSHRNTKVINTIIENDSLIKEYSVLVKINDTLIYDDEIYGDIIVYNKLQDSIKRSNNDLRKVTTCLNIFSNKEDIISLNKKTCDTFYQANLDFDKIRIPFRIKPKSLGNQFVSGVINEQLILDAYKYNDSTESRFVEFDYYFAKKVYIKKKETPISKQI